MANDVFANGREISCKAADGKSICAFPDVCFTPPTAPPTPPGVPIPYPNTGMAKDTTSGSKQVKISGKEVMLRNKSYFKTSTGDEAGSAPKKGIITSKIKGKIYFKSWSMDVKVEGKNVVRHFDMTTHNHASDVGNESIPWPYADSMAASTGQDKCEAEKNVEKEACNPAPTLQKVPGVKKKRLLCSKACAEAKACRLVPKKDDKTACCHPDTTGDHLIEANCFTPKGGRKKKRTFPEFKGYDHEKAPTACVRPPNACAGKKNNHNAMQAWREESKLAAMMGQMREHGKPMKVGPGGEEFHWSYDEAAEAGATSHNKVNPHCSKECTRAQLDQYHQKDPQGPQCSGSTPVRTAPRSWEDRQFSGGREFAIAQGNTYMTRV